MARPVTSRSAHVSAARIRYALRGAASSVVSGLPSPLPGRLPTQWRTLRNLGGMGLLAILAACSTAPMRSGGVSSSVPYVRTEPAPASRPEGLPEFIDHSVGEEEISIEAMSLVGVPYRWGGNTPDSGFDCSGLVKYVVRRAASVNLPRTTAQMEYAGRAITPDQVAPGDLIFFDTDGRPYSHVGIYVGHYRFVDAPSTGGTVRIDYVTNPYWARHFNGIRRVAIGHPAPFQSAPLEAAAPAASSAGPITAMQHTERNDDVNDAPDVRTDDAIHPGMSDPPNTRGDAASGNGNPGQDEGGASLTVPLYAGPRTIGEPVATQPASTAPAAPARTTASIDNNMAHTVTAPSAAHASAQPDAQADTQPDPIAQIANLSGAGSVSEAHAIAPSTGPTSGTEVTSSAPTAASPAVDPIAAFAGSKF